jgi:hypothetical protein
VLGLELRRTIGILQGIAESLLVGLFFPRIEFARTKLWCAICGLLYEVLTTAVI